MQMVKETVWMIQQIAIEEVKYMREMSMSGEKTEFVKFVYLMS